MSSPYSKANRFAADTTTHENKGDNVPDDGPSGNAENKENAEPEVAQNSGPDKTSTVTEKRAPPKTISRVIAPRHLAQLFVPPDHFVHNGLLVRSSQAGDSNKTPSKVSKKSNKNLQISPANESEIAAAQKRMDAYFAAILETTNAASSSILGKSDTDSVMKTPKASKSKALQISPARDDEIAAAQKKMEAFLAAKQETALLKTVSQLTNQTTSKLIEEDAPTTSAASKLEMDEKIDNELAEKNMSNFLAQPNVRPSKTFPPKKTETMPTTAEVPVVKLKTAKLQPSTLEISPAKGYEILAMQKRMELFLAKQTDATNQVGQQPQKEVALNQTVGANVLGVSSANGNQAPSTSQQAGNLLETSNVAPPPDGQPKKDKRLFLGNVELDVPTQSLLIEEQGPEEHSLLDSEEKMNAFLAHPIVRPSKPFPPKKSETMPSTSAVPVNKPKSESTQSSSLQISPARDTDIELMKKRMALFFAKQTGVTNTGEQQLQKEVSHNKTEVTDVLKTSSVKDTHVSEAVKRIEALHAFYQADSLVNTPQRSPSPAKEPPEPKPNGELDVQHQSVLSEKQGTTDSACDDAEKKMSAFLAQPNVRPSKKFPSKLPTSDTMDSDQRVEGSTTLQSSSLQISPAKESEIAMMQRRMALYFAQNSATPKKVEQQPQKEILSKEVPTTVSLLQNIPAKGNNITKAVEKIEISGTTQHAEKLLMTPNVAPTPEVQSEEDKQLFLDNVGLDAQAQSLLIEEQNTEKLPLADAERKMNAFLANPNVRPSKKFPKLLPTAQPMSVISEMLEDEPMPTDHGNTNFEWEDADKKMSAFLAHSTVKLLKKFPKLLPPAHTLSTISEVPEEEPKPTALQPASTQISPAKESDIAMMQKRMELFFARMNSAAREVEQQPQKESPSQEVEATVRLLGDNPAEDNNVTKAVGEIEASNTSQQSGNLHEAATIAPSPDEQPKQEKRLFLEDGELDVQTQSLFIQEQGSEKLLLVDAEKTSESTCIDAQKKMSAFLAHTTVKPSKQFPKVLPTTQTLSIISEVSEEEPKPTTLQASSSHISPAKDSDIAMMQKRMDLYLAQKSAAEKKVEQQPQKEILSKEVPTTASLLQNIPAKGNNITKAVEKIEISDTTQQQSAAEKGVEQQPQKELVTNETGATKVLQDSLTENNEVAKAVARIEAFYAMQKAENLPRTPNASPSSAEKPKKTQRLLLKGGEPSAQTQSLLNKKQRYPIFECEDGGKKMKAFLAHTIFKLTKKFKKLLPPAHTLSTISEVPEEEPKLTALRPSSSQISPAKDSEVAMMQKRMELFLAQKAAAAKGVEQQPKKNLAHNDVLQENLAEDNDVAEAVERIEDFYALQKAENLPTTPVASPCPAEQPPNGKRFFLENGELDVQIQSVLNKEQISTNSESTETGKVIDTQPSIEQQSIELSPTAKTLPSSSNKDKKSALAPANTQISPAKESDVAMMEKRMAAFLAKKADGSKHTGKTNLAVSKSNATVTATINGPQVSPAKDNEIAEAQKRMDAFLRSKNKTAVLTKIQPTPVKVDDPPASLPTAQETVSGLNVVKLADPTPETTKTKTFVSTLEKKVVPAQAKIPPPPTPQSNIPPVVPTSVGDPQPTALTTNNVVNNPANYIMPGHPKWLEAQMAMLFGLHVPIQPQPQPQPPPVPKPQPPPPPPVPVVPPTPVILSVIVCPKKVEAALLAVQEEIHQEMIELQKNSRMTIVSEKVLKSSLSKPDLFDNVPDDVAHAWTPCQTPVKMQFDQKMRPAPPKYGRKELLPKRPINLAFPQRAKKSVKFHDDCNLVSNRLSFDEVVEIGGSGFRILSVTDHNSNTVRFPKYDTPGCYFINTQTNLDVKK